MVPSLGLLLNAALRIIDCAGTSIGRLCVDQDANAVRIVDIALLPQWQGRGIGSRRLYERLLGFQACGDARLYTPMQRPAGTLDQSLKDAPNP